MAKATYKDAGVDLDVYRESMSRLPRLLTRTHTPRVMKLEGGFAGLFQLDFSSPLFARGYEDPVLVSCTDGVGTKLKVAQAAGIHNTVGIDLVAMSVNDALCCGAEPLFFLDYVAMSHDDPARLEQIVEGISAGCIESDCALLGGETAIMPDLYARDDYDLAGFCVGVVERRRVIDGKAISRGDKLIGVASSGLHSNGFSLARKVAFEMGGLKPSDHVKELGRTVGEELLEPTRIYARPLRKVLANYKIKSVVHGVAHITGGGLHENLRGSCPPAAGPSSSAAVGRFRPCSAGCSDWARSTPTKWTACSTWDWGWRWSSALISPTAFAINWMTAVWQTGSSAKSSTASRAWPGCRRRSVSPRSLPSIRSGSPVLASAFQESRRSGMRQVLRRRVSG